MHNDYATSRGNYYNQHALEFGGAKQDRTADLLRARQALSQLSYSPIRVIFNCSHVICVNTRKAEAFIKTFYFKIRR